MSAFLGLVPQYPSPTLEPPPPYGGTSSQLRPLRHRRPATSLPSTYTPYPPDAPCPPNRTMVQGFEWYCPPDFQHWRRLTKIIPTLAQLGITQIWIPPACKASWKTGNGYDIYDLYDLGEFEQKGSRKTKWGGKEELQQLVAVGAQYGVSVLFDAVLNHKAAADFKEPVLARRVNPKDRRVVLDRKPTEIEAWTGYDFPGRQGMYSPLRWSARHFTGIDYDDLRKENAIWKFEGKEWAEDVDEENGNYDYLMFADIDHQHPEVKRDLFHWTWWLKSQLPQLGGLRLDAIKHYSYSFVREFLANIDRHVAPGPPGSPGTWFIVGEYWREDSEFLARYIEFMHHRLSLFDVQLVSNFSRISLASEHLQASPTGGGGGAPGITYGSRDTDLRTLFDDTLCIWKPHNAVSFVVNHDTQKGQSLETPIAPFFMPLAYSLILLRANAGVPCVFWSDLYGSFGVTSNDTPASEDAASPRDTPLPDPQHWKPPMCGGQVLPKLMLARRLWAYGTQYDYLDHPHCVGFTRTGHYSQSGGAGVACVMANWWEHASKRMYVGVEHAGEVWTDVLKFCPGEVMIDESGWGVFPVAARSVAVWVSRDAEGREGVDAFELDTDVYGFNQRHQEQVYENQRGPAVEEEPEDWMVAARGAAAEYLAMTGSD
ncbi:Amy1 [Neurospora crassa OR74A]|uniref:Amy1 n=1 Tax=Neurospora crassa (strain ATCC 24698 / 74-OR23-1A / CBS 708.71 / DSM 1257 / FGSC 987) TaxID=367110 RepID=Q7S535_NEUCR|nr:Amy1 [Neurospora crassa OR74A]EAA30628.3 Amy1 [Neurospora crassa OR74A]|eukprot:XP_959864.3 Amy1 [Neurospora crassa OR74A]